MQELKQTPLYPNHLKHGGKMVSFGGWALPERYSSIVEEHIAVRTHAGLFDVSHMGEILVSGKDAAAFLDSVCTNVIGDMPVGRCRYSPLCYENGGTVDDLILYRLQNDSFLIIANASNAQKDLDWLVAHQQSYADLSIIDASSDYAQLALQGPAFAEILAKTGCEGTLPEKPYAFTTQFAIASIPCMVSTTGYTGESGIEIYLSPEHAGALFDQLIAAGATPCGLGARDTLRFEASMPLYGHELSESITPLEAGLKSFVKLEKSDFIGKAALATAPRRMRIGLEITDRGIAREHCPVMTTNGKIIGETTSGGPAPALKKNLAMALIDVDAKGEEALVVEVRGKPLQAKRIKMSFYKASAKQ